MTLGRVCALIAVPLLALATSAAVATSAGPPVPHYHRMACAHTTPTALAISWQVESLRGPRSAGHKTFRQPRVVEPMYRDVCALTLVSYDRPVVCACPAAFGSGLYHLAFLRGRGNLLRITEHDLGIIDLSVDGRPKLGTATLNCLILPPGIPTVSPPRVVRPGRMNCLR